MDEEYATEESKNTNPNVPVLWTFGIPIFLQPQMLQQALWSGGPDQGDEGQEVDLFKSMTGAGLERSSAPEHFQKGSSGAFT